jgi:hypothetical protein
MRFEAERRLAMTRILPRLARVRKTPWVLPSTPAPVPPSLPLPVDGHFLYGKHPQSPLASNMRCVGSAWRSAYVVSSPVAESQPVVVSVPPTACPPGTEHTLTLRAPASVPIGLQGFVNVAENPNSLQVRRQLTALVRPSPAITPPVPVESGATSGNHDGCADV